MFASATVFAQDSAQQPHYQQNWPCTGKERAFDPTYAKVSEATGGHLFLFDKSETSGMSTLMIGDMKTEMSSFLAPDDKVWHRTLTEAEMRDRIHAIAGSHTDRVIETYGRLHPGTSPAERLIAATTDSNFRIRSLALAQRKAAQNAAPVWMYSFEWETPLFDGRLGAPHALDVPFCFDTIDLTNATDMSDGAKIGRAHV